MASTGFLLRTAWGKGGAASENSPTRTSSSHPAGAGGRATGRGRHLRRGHGPWRRTEPGPRQTELDAWRRGRHPVRGGGLRKRNGAGRRGGAPGAHVRGRHQGGLDGPLPEHPHPHSRREERLRPGRHGGGSGHVGNRRVEGAGQLERVAEAIARLHGKCTAHDAGQRRRDPQRLEQRRGAGEDGHVGVGLALERILPGEAGVQDEPETVDVAPARGGHRPAQHLLRALPGHEVGGGAGQPHAEPGDERHSGAADEQVRRAEPAVEDGPLVLPFLVGEVDREAGVPDDARGDLGREPPTHREDLGEGLSVGVLDGDGEAPVRLVEPERPLDVRMVKGVDRARELPRQTLPGRGIHAGQVDDPGDPWSVPLLEKQPQPLALTSRKGPQELNPPTRHVGDGSTMYPWMRKFGGQDPGPVRSAGPRPDPSGPRGAPLPRRRGPAPRDGRRPGWRGTGRRGRSRPPPPPGGWGACRR